MLALLALALAELGLAPSAPDRSQPAAAAIPTAAAVQAAPASTPAVEGAEDRAREAYERLPLAFAPNRGQSDERVRYLARGAGFGFYFTHDRARLSFVKQGEAGPFGPLAPPDFGRGRREASAPPQAMALDLRFLGARSDVRVAAERRGAGTVNELGAGAAQAALPSYAGVRYHSLWQGIDMRFEGQGGKLKYEFLLRPGADPNKIKLAYAGAQGLAAGAGGSLLIETPLGTLRDSAPKTYQRIGGRRVPVESRYSLTAGGRGYGFELGAYDRSQPLVIDPGIAYSTFLGGGGDDFGGRVAVDGAGNSYVTGATNSADFPKTTGAFDQTHNGDFDAFVTKLNATGSGIAYSTFLGGVGVDFGSGIAIDAAGSAYVTGVTDSTGFPTTPGAIDTTHNGDFDAFVTKLNATGSNLSYSTFLGGSAYDQGNAIAVDGTGSAYVTGITSSASGGSGGFPTTAGAFDTTHNGDFDAFVTKLNPAGSVAPSYSTFLGGTSGEDAQGITVDGTGSAYVAGTTTSADFPTTPGAFAPTGDGLASDGYVTKLNTTGSAPLAYSTFLGGGGTDSAVGITVDGTGLAYVVGYTVANDFPTTAGAFDETHNGLADAFVTKLNATGSALSYSTFLGGAADDVAFGIAIDSTGSAYVTGDTGSLNFPTTPGAIDTTPNGDLDAFVSKLNANGAGLSYSTFLGGNADDRAFGIALDGTDAYVTGQASATFPTTAGAFDTTYGGGVADGFVTKLDLAPPADPGGGGGGGGGGAAGGGSGGGAAAAGPEYVLPGRCTNVRRGTAGRDTLNGTTGSDRLLGLGGNDILNGLQGDDCLDGGAGNDRLTGASGNDSLAGGTGSDKLSGSTGKDRLAGGASKDSLNAGTGNDRVDGGAGNDVVDGGSGNDSIKGGSGADRISGGTGKNTISAGSGNDAIVAANGRRERINCGSGRDRVTADKRDKLRGCERVRRTR